MQQGVECHEHLYAVRMGVVDYLGQILDTITGCLTRTEHRCTDIDSIGTCLDSRFRYFFVARRREEAKRYITMPAVTDTFIECFVPYWGISIHWLH